MNANDWRPADFRYEGKCRDCAAWFPLLQRTVTQENTGERGVERKLREHGCETDGTRFEFVPDRWSHTC